MNKNAARPMSDVINHRPNIVATLAKSFALSEQNAVKRAIDVNNTMVSNAQDALSKIDNSDELIKYSESIRVKTK